MICSFIFFVEIRMQFNNKFYILANMRVLLLSSNLGKN